MVLTWNVQVVVLLDIMLRYERARMKFTVVAVGKLKERFWVDACAEYLKLLAIDGKERSSEGLSKRLDNLMLQGKSNFAFVIGGSDGVSDEVRKRANEFLSFGPITLPHNLARVVLLEQLYRSHKISHGEPYHK